MADSLNDETQERMRALCRKISVAHDLDPEIQDELYGHMEDKLLAYLNGEEPVTEDDAFILVREHFGDPAVLKGLLQDVHAYEVHVSLARRLAAVTVASLTISVVWSVSFSLLVVGLVLWAAWVGPTTNLNLFRNSCGVILGAGTLVLLWALLRYWNRLLDAGQRPWFLKWRPTHITAVVLGLLMLSNLVPDVRTAPGVLGEGMGTAYSMWVQWIMVVLILLYPLVQPILWLWWCDRPPRRVRTGVYAFFAWFVFRLTSVALTMTHSLPRLMLNIGDHDPGVSLNASPLARLAYGQISGSIFHWKLSFEPWGSNIQPVLDLYRFMQLAERMLLYGAVAVLVYSLVQHVQRRYTKSERCASETSNG